MALQKLTRAELACLDRMAKRARQHRRWADEARKRSAEAAAMKHDVEAARLRALTRTGICDDGGEG